MIRGSSCSEKLEACRYIPPGKAVIDIQACCPTTQLLSPADQAGGQGQSVEPRVGVHRDELTVELHNLHNCIIKIEL